MKTEKHCNQRPRLVIAGTNSGSGKTTVTMALLQALVNNNLKVQGYKVGPDYIDPSWHTSITKRPARNLDTWMMPEDTMKEIFQRGSQDADISVIEGVMGLFDGKSGSNDKGSTADIAKQLHAPVILVVNAASQARSAAAVVHGFKSFDPDLNVCGVIFNKVASKSHYEFLKEAMSSVDGVELLGYLPKDPKIQLPERHLGLIPANEQDNLDDQVKKLADHVSQYIDLNKIIELANKHSNWTNIPKSFHAHNNSSNLMPSDSPKIKVAIAQDESFSFYYRDNLEWMESRGVEWIPVSPINDEKLPADISGIYLGGGFPEIYAEKLSNNISFKNQLQKLYFHGLPILAECGGFMYLSKALIDIQGIEYPMANLIPGKVKMKNKLQALGYRQGIAENDSILLSQGDSIKGHEFRYSEYISETHDVTDMLPAYQLIGRRKTTVSGFVKNNLLASYFHVHLGSNPQAGYRWLNHLKNAPRFASQQ